MMKSKLRIPGKRFVQTAMSWADVVAVFLVKDFNTKQNKTDLTKKRRDVLEKDICLIVLVSYKEKKAVSYIEEQIESEIRNFFPNIIVLALDADVYYLLLGQGHKFAKDFLSHGSVIYPWDGYRTTPNYLSSKFRERSLEDNRIVAKNFLAGFDLAESANLTIDSSVDTAMGIAYYSCCHFLNGYILHQIGWRSNRTNLFFLARLSRFIDDDLETVFPPGQKGERRIQFLQQGAKSITDIQLSEQSLFRKRKKETDLEELDIVLRLITTKLEKLIPKNLLVPTKKLEKWMKKTSEKKQG